MSDLGALLRKAREQRGYTLEDIQDYTKIRKRYLEAIETGDYKVLPGSFYVRAFVKTYAETVGLDAEEVLRLYHKELPKPSTTESVMAEPARIKAGRRSHQHNDRWGKVAVSLLMWAFPILIVVVIYIYLSNNKDAGTKELNSNPPITSEISSESPSASVSPSPTPTVSASPTPSETVTLTFKEKRNSINYYDVTPGTGRKLKLVVADKCWIEVRSNNNKGKKLFYTTQVEPFTLNFDLTTPLYVSVGRSDFVEIYIDDVMVDDGNKPGTTRYLFTPVNAPLQ